MRNSIVVLDGYTLNPGDNPWSPLQELGHVTAYDRTQPGEVVERASGTAIVLTNKTPLTAEMLQHLPDLRYVGVLATGYNVVDLTAARERNIVVTNIPEYSTDSVAEFVFSLLLNFARRPALHSELVHAGEWQNSTDFSFCRTPQIELRDKTLGIVGFGRIGRRVASLGASLGMRIIANNRSPVDTSELAFPVQMVTLPHLFETARVVTLHCPQTPENTGFIDASLLRRMRPDALLINTGRGGLINEGDLAAALEQGIPAAAAVDVVTTEPINPANPLLSAPNCVITPHIAWATLEARRRLMHTAAENLIAWRAGRPLNVVN